MNKPKQTVEIVVTFVVVETCIWTIERWMEEPYLGCRLQSHLQVSLLYVDMTILLRLKVSYCRSWPQCPLIVFTSVRTIKIIKPKTSTLSCAHKCQQQAFVSFFFFICSGLYARLSDEQPLLQILEWPHKLGAGGRICEREHSRSRRALRQWPYKFKCHGGISYSGELSLPLTHGFTMTFRSVLRQ